MKLETLLYTKSNTQQVVEATTKQQEIHYLVNYNNIHSRKKIFFYVWKIKCLDEGRFGQSRFLCTECEGGL